MSDKTSSLFGAQNPGINELQLYPATVVLNNDPKMLGRIKARVEKIFDGISDSDLPWSIPTFEHPDGASATSGIMMIPKVGSKVLLHFQGGSPFHPIHQGYTVDAQTSLPEAHTNYPNRAVIRFQNGLVVVIDTSTNEVFARCPGDIHALIEGNLDLTVLGNFTTRVGGNADTTVKQNSVTRIVGSDTTEVGGASLSVTGGASQKFVGGTDGYYVTGNHTRVAQNVYDNPSAGAPGTPNVPPGTKPPAWPGIRGDTSPNKWS